MAQFILNIGLDSSPDSGNPRATNDANCRAAIKWLQERMTVGKFALGASRTTDDTLVFSGELRPSRLSELAEVANQDCIAVWSLDAGFGKLVGPRPKKWEPFRVAEFLWPKPGPVTLH